MGYNTYTHGNVTRNFPQTDLKQKCNLKKIMEWRAEQVLSGMVGTSGRGRMWGNVVGG
jgi:hypothetical protein